jgi:WD40 repeat protein
MSSKMLYDAIALVRAGKNDEARQIIFEIIRTDPRNEMAWMWLAETLSSDVDRMKVLHACLQQNSDSKLTLMAIDRLQEKMDEEIPSAEPETPFTEGGTFDPTARERTGHTGAIIGYDGSFILSEVPDFDEVIDLRSPGEEELIVKPLAQDIDEDSEFEEELEDINETASPTGDDTASEPVTEEQADQLDEKIDEPASEDMEELFLDPYAESEEDSARFSKELEFEPDLSSLFEQEGADEKTLIGAPAENNWISDDTFVTPFSAEDSDPEALSTEELGFNEPIQLGPRTPYVDDEITQMRMVADSQLVEDHVMENSVEENTLRRKKRERRTIFFIVAFLLFITALCIAAILIIGNYSRNSVAVVTEPTLPVVVSTTDIPTALPVLLPTVTLTPQPTEIPTAAPTVTPLVQLSQNAINPDNAGNIALRLNQGLPGSFFNNLDGDLIAVIDGKSIQVWDVAAGALKYTLIGHNNNISDIAFSPDDQYLVSGAVDFSVILWNLQTGVIEKSFGLDGNIINRIYGDSTKNYPRAVSVDYSPDGTTLAAGAFGIVSVFDIPTGYARGTFALSDEDLALVSQDVPQLSGFSVKFNDNGWVVSAAMSKRLYGVDSLDAAVLYQYELGALARVHFNDDRISMVEEDTGGVLIRNLVDGRVVTGFDGRKEKPNQASPDYSLSDNGRIIAIEADGTVVPVQLSVWDVVADTNLLNYSGLCLDGSCRIPVFGLSFDGSLVAHEVLGLDGSLELKVFNLVANTENHQFDQVDGGVKSVAFSPDGQLVAAIDQDSVMHIWDIAIGAERVIIQTNNANNVSFSRNGQILYAWGDDFIQAWSLPPN